MERNEVDLIEVPGFKDFYYYPKYKRIGVSKNGKILDLTTKQIIKPLIDNNKPRSFVSLHIDNKNVLWFSYARLLSMTFIGKPLKYKDRSLTELNVKHLDYNLYNNSLDNLEWTDDCSLPENWVNYNATLFDIYDLRDNKINVELHAHQLLDFIKFIAKRDLDILMLHRYMIIHPEGIKVGNFLIHFSDDNIDWDKIKFEHTVKGIPDYTKNTVIAENVITGEEKIFDTIKEAACFFDMNTDKLRHHLDTDIYEKHRYGLWLINKYQRHVMPYHDLNSGSIYPPVDSVSVCYHDKINDEHYIFLHLYVLIDKYKNINVDEAIYYLRQDRRYETKYGTITFLEDTY